MAIPKKPLGTNRQHLIGHALSLRCREHAKRKGIAELSLFRIETASSLFFLFTRHIKTERLLREIKESHLARGEQSRFRRDKGEKALLAAYETRSLRRKAELRQQRRELPHKREPVIRQHNDRAEFFRFFISEHLLPREF